MRRSPQTIESLEEKIAIAATILGPNLDGFSVQELAKQAEVAIGTIYRILPTKNHLEILVQKYCENVFHKYILAPIPAKYDLKSRFELVFHRLSDFIANENKIAQFLSMYGISDNSQFKRAIAAFIDEAANMGEIDARLKPIAFPLIWGPISSIIGNPEIASQSGEILGQSVWKALKI